MSKKDELRKEIYQLERKFEKRTKKRNIIFCFFYIIVCFILAIIFNEIGSIKDVLECVAIGLIGGIVNFFVGAVIFGYMYNKNERQAEVLKSMREQYNRME